MLHPDATHRRTWTPARQLTPLHDNEVQVWRLRVDLDGHARAAAAAIAEVVTADERDRAARFRQEADRQRFLHGRLLLRTFLGHHLGISPRTVAFVNSAFGKPEIERPAVHTESGSDRPAILRFNLAHSGEWVLFALARDREVGVDVEHHRSMSDLMDLARRFFARPEVAALEALDPALRDDAFFRVWTRKEAIVKAIGQGLSAGLDRFAVSADGVGAAENDDGAAQVALRGLDDDPVWQRWTIHALDMPSSYAAAVAFDRHASPPRAGAAAAHSLGGDAMVTVTRFEWTPS
jgi:4'-phosphopantetheinyl transferase